MSRVAVCQSADRAAGVAAVVGRMIPPQGPNPIAGQAVLLKPNFNTADAAPGSTHDDTLLALVDELWRLGAASITLGERSWQDTHAVIAKKGIAPALEAKDVRIVVFDDLPESDWVEFDRPGFHWPQGMRIARPVLESSCLVETCCVKTHAYGGVFTMSLKLAVGTMPGGRQIPHYMSELHASPHQRKMIAEINAAFSPVLVVMDGVDVFIDGGPATGRRARGELMLAASDRVALDATGLAALKDLGANQDIVGRPIFGQEQIARAVELGLGATGPAEIELLPCDPASQPLAQRLEAILEEG